MYKTERERLLFETLSSVSAVLRRLGVKHWLSSGTLLGAYRDGKIIASDNDWDLDCLTKDIPTILTARDEFKALGLDVCYPCTEARSVDLQGNSVQETMLKQYIKFSHPEYGHIGDIFTYVIFSDGIARRYNLEQKSWVNPKMSVPAWYLEGETTVMLYGQPFPAPADPESYILKVYGPDWRTPIERYVKKQGYNHSVSVIDSNIEMMVEHALRSGWKPDYLDCPNWPQEIKMCHPYSGLSWRIKHDHPEVWMTPPLTGDSHSLSESVVRCRLLLSRKNEEIRSLKKELEVMNRQIKNSRFLIRCMKDYLKGKILRILGMKHG